VKVQHLVLTRFSFRNWTGFAGEIGGIDPLSRPFLRRRFMLLESICLPSLCGQTEQGFRWIVIVDRDLPRRWRARLTRLVSARERTFLHDFAGQAELEAASWLAPYLEEPERPVLVTMVDDDDAPCRTFVEQVQGLAAREWERSSSGLAMFGAREAAQWDFVSTRRARLGYRKPWTRTTAGIRVPVSCGFSMLCDASLLGRSLFYFDHRLSPFLFTDERILRHLRSRLPEDHRRVETMRRVLRDVYGSDREEPGGGRFRWVADDAPQALMVNHLDNFMFDRLLDTPESRSPVSGPDSLPGFAVDLDAARKYARHFSLSPIRLLRLLRRFDAEAPRGHLGQRLRTLREVWTRLPR
jgi:hypothetical protein